MTKATGGFSPRDYLAVEHLCDPRVSPDGGRLAYVSMTADAEDDTYLSAIMVASLDPETGGWGPGRPFTPGFGQDSLPRWSPDGRSLAFLSDRALPRAGKRGKPGPVQVWVAPADGGEARPVTACPDPITEFCWAPDGRRLVLVSLAASQRPPRWAEDPGVAKRNADVRRIDRLFYQTDTLHLEGRRSRVWAVDVEEALTAEPGQLPAWVATPLTPPGLDCADPSLSPDGRYVAVTVNDHPLILPRRAEILVFDVPPDAASGAAGSPPRRLTPGDRVLFAPAWAPDGRRIAFVGHEGQAGLHSTIQLWVVDVAPDGRPEGSPRCLTKALDACIGPEILVDAARTMAPQWSPDGTRLLVVVSQRGKCHLTAVDAVSGQAERLPWGSSIQAWTTSARGETTALLAFGPRDLGRVEAIRWPAISRSSLPPASPATVARASARLLDARRLSVPERYAFRSGSGELSDAWVLAPEAGRENRACPAVLYLHGGPMAMHSDIALFECQVLAGAGFGVICPNPRGSLGYSEAFSTALAGHWASPAFEDIVLALDEGLRRFSWIDPGRLGIGGASYGGYLTAWTIGHTDRFRAAWVVCGLTDLLSHFGTSDAGFMRDEEWGARPWDGAGRLIAESPLTYADRIKTPTLIVHGENDLRVPIQQAEELFVALKRLGCDVEFHRYPGEGHSLNARPWHYVDLLTNMVAWFDLHLKHGERRPGAAG